LESGTASARLRAVKIEVIVQPNGSPTVGERVIGELGSGSWDGFRCAVAFAKISGVRYLDPLLRRFVAGGGWAALSVGVDSRGTSFEALSQLAGAVDARGRLFVVQDPASPGVSFHPKVYAFVKGERENPERALAIIGSCNITMGGLFTNHEASIALRLDASDPDDAAVLADVISRLDSWHDESSANSTVADADELISLHRSGLLPSERQIAERRQTKSARRPTGETGGGNAKIFKPLPTPGEMGAPLIDLPETDEEGLSTLADNGDPQLQTGAVVLPDAGAATSPHSAFFIDIPNDTAKTEVYLSKVALEEDPDFFGHPFTGLTNPKRSTSTPQPKRQPSPVVDIRLLDASGTVVSDYTDHSLTIWQYAHGPSANQDVRITIPAALLHSLPDDCILEIRRHPVRAGIEYTLDFLTPGSSQWETARSRANRLMQGGKRKMGWG
jgi:HKD family nuclease